MRKSKGTGTDDITTGLMGRAQQRGTEECAVTTPRRSLHIERAPNMWQVLL